MANPNNLIYTDEAYYEPTPWGTIATVPHTPLAYRETAADGITPPRCTMEIEARRVLSTISTA